MRRDVGVVGVLALLVRIPAFFAPQSLSFDDGVFAMSVIAMRHGGLPFRDVFSSQGPLFLPIAWLGDLIAFRALDSPRAAAVLAGVALAVFALLIGRRVTTSGAAFLGAVLVALSGSVLWTTAPLTSDGIGEALTAAAVLTALAYAHRPSVRRAVVLGVVAGAALSVKSLMVIPGLVAAGLWVLHRRRAKDATVVPIVAMATLVVVSLPWGVHRVYEQYVQYHLDAVADRPIAANASKLARTLFERDAPLLVAAAIALLAAIGGIIHRGLAHRRVSRRRFEPPASSTPAAGTAGTGTASGGARLPWYPLLVWLLGALIVVLTGSPMWRNHVAHLVLPIALLLGVGAATKRVAALATIGALLMAPWSVVHLGELIRPQPYRGIAVTRQRILADLPIGALAISDSPGDVWRAGRRTPDEFVDVSILRITSPTRASRLTGTELVRVAARPDVCAVVRWSSKRFTHFPHLGARLRAVGYRTALTDRGTPRVVWVKRQCEPGGRPDRASAMAPRPGSPG